MVPKMFAILATVVLLSLEIHVQSTAVPPSRQLQNAPRPPSTFNTNRLFLRPKATLSESSCHVPLRLKGGVEDDSGDDAFSSQTFQPEGRKSMPELKDVKTMFKEDGADWSSMDKDKVFQGLRELYLKKVKPLEDHTWYGHFSTGATLEASDFDAKPIVLLMGQYSVGKTSFIRSLLGQDFPGMRIGPEPTTDRFVAVMHGNDERVVPGHALSMQKDSPFHGLAEFGNNFLSKFMGSNCGADILRNITLIDTPGVLAGEKQRSGRSYDYGAVVEWFAQRSDLIIVMFDAHKLDMSDEMSAVLDKLKIHQEKIRIVLNKVQQIDTQHLMRVYGALMWALGKVLNVPEVPRVYMGSFWDQDETNTDADWWGSSAHQELLEREKRDLLHELASLPQSSIMRRVSELVKRARVVKVHAYVIHYLRKQIAGWATVTVWNKAEKQAALIAGLEREFIMAARRYNLPLGDFPNVQKMKASLREIKDLRDIPRLNKNYITDMEKIFSTDIPKLLEEASKPSSRPARRFLD
mmetsp:Transcript_45204/g.107135  ORF Transcript_45204/g.107135 Transcript_45204/m.107135 type:complete len:522 (+) Transcript_45204:229-1794(+)